jgi:GNAT superfamily N-acetyltransferase
MLDLEIRPVDDGDEDALIVASGQDGYCADRLVRQAAGLGFLLAVWCEDRPVGWTFLWTAAAEEDDLQKHLEDVPLITHLEVFDPAHRGLGIGTALIAYAEGLLRDKGYDRVALAVEESNKDAARLYQRLHYEDWGWGELVCQQREWLPDGGELVIDEKCYVFVKDLTRAAAGQFADSCAESAVLQS